jgi:hypothetical protein
VQAWADQSRDPHDPSALELADHLGVDHQRRPRCIEGELKVNASEHISHIVSSLAEEDNITREQCVEIIRALLAPYIGKREPKHFTDVNYDLIHPILDKLDRLEKIAQYRWQRA